MIRIKNREISINNPPFIIAELSANHGGSISKALSAIKSAKSAGADAIKIQTYNADTMTIKSCKEDFKIKDGLWKGYTLYDLYNDAHTPFEWHSELFEYANKIGITIFSSPFDETAVDLLEKLDTPAYKIASFELCDIPLIKYIAKKKKPMLMSTGMANISEINEAVEAAKSNGCDQILLFHCISSYPAPTEDSNLNNLVFLKKEFEVEIGLSDHSMGNTASIASIALGATAIEKHFTLNRNDKGPDSSFSIEPKELAELKKCTTEVWEALGSKGFHRSTKEIQNKIFRRSLYFVRSLKKGNFVTKNDIKRIRPGYGLSPKYEDNIIGKVLDRDVERGDPVNWNLFKK